MIVRRWTAKIKQGRADDYEAFATNVSRQMFQAHDGYLGCIMTHDGTHAEVLTLWRDHAAIQALESSDQYAATVARILAADLLESTGPTQATPVHLVDLPDPLIQ